MVAVRAGEHARPTRPRRPRRRSDRVADLTAWAVSAAALLVLLASLVIGMQSARALTERAAAEERDRTPVTAIALDDVGLAPESGSTVLARVRWTEGDGIERTGSVEVTGPLTAGDEVTTWVTGEHRLVRAPLSQLEVLFVAVATGTVVLAVGELLVLVLGRLAFAGVARRHAADWEREWEEVEPTWSGR